MNWEPIDECDEGIAHCVIGAAIEVHRHLGPGFLESIYKKAMVHELTASGLLVEWEKDRVNHVHVKDVSESLAQAVWGAQTGIAVSHCAIGDGVNAGNIRQVLTILRDRGYSGVLSMECEGQAGPMIERSLSWLRSALRELGIPEEGGRREL